jgi:hypothetical protein
MEGQMVIPSETKRPGMSPDDSELTPLISDEVRSFLDGKIPAETYMEFVRRHAAHEASRDAAFAPMRRPSLASSLIALAIAGYAIVGAALSLDKGNSGLAFIAGAGGIVTGAVVSIAIEKIIRRD